MYATSHRSSSFRFLNTHRDREGQGGGDEGYGEALSLSTVLLSLQQKAYDTSTESVLYYRLYLVVPPSDLSNPKLVREKQFF